MLLLVFYEVSCNELTGDNVCLQKERVPVHVTKTFPKNVTVRQYEWCLNVPPRCSFYTYKTVQEQRAVVEYETRIVRKCCPGFNEVKGQCISQCEGCVNGICSEENKCLCRAGFHGDDCNIQCDSHKWGPYCRHNCICENGHCDPVTGKCDCSPGWNGTSCEQQCSSGYFGPNCHTRCSNCETCHHVTGECIPTTIVTTKIPTTKYTTTKDLSRNYPTNHPTTKNKTTNDPYASNTIRNTTPFYSAGTGYQITKTLFAKDTTTKMPTTKLTTTKYVVTSDPSITYTDDPEIEEIITSLPDIKFEEELHSYEESNEDEMKNEYLPAVNVISAVIDEKDPTETPITNKVDFDQYFNISQPSTTPQPQQSISYFPVENHDASTKSQETSTEQTNELMLPMPVEKKITKIHSERASPRNTLDSSSHVAAENTSAENVNVVQSIENNGAFLTVCIAFASTLLLLMVICVYSIVRRNYINQKQENETMMSGQGVKNGDHSVSVFTKSIFHSPLPEPPVFGNPVFTPPIERSSPSDKTFEAHVVCSINFPNKTNTKNTRDVAELFYDHPPSTGSYRAASSLGPPEMELKSEPLYDEIPCWKLPMTTSMPPPSYRSEDASSLYMNTNLT